MKTLSFLLLVTQKVIGQIKFDSSCTRETRATENELKVELDRILNPNVYDIRPGRCKVLTKLFFFLL